MPWDIKMLIDWLKHEYHKINYYCECWSCLFESLLDLVETVINLIINAFECEGIVEFGAITLSFILDCYLICEIRKVV